MKKEVTFNMLAWTKVFSMEHVILFSPMIVRILLISALFTIQQKMAENTDLFGFVI